MDHLITEQEMDFQRRLDAAKTHTAAERILRGSGMNAEEAAFQAGIMFGVTDGDVLAPKDQ